MTTRNQWPRKFSEALHKLDESLGSAEWNYELAHKQIHVFLIESLSPQEAKIYEWVCEQPFAVNGWNVAYQFKIKHNHASTMLKSLHDLGLLKRKQIIDESGKFYMYSKK